MATTWQPHGNHMATTHRKNTLQTLHLNPEPQQRLPHAPLLPTAYIFPAVGMAALLTHARAISDEAFVVAAEALSQMTTPTELETGRLFPAFDHIRAISKVLAARVAEHMVATGDGGKPEQCGQWEEYVAQNMWTA